MFLSRSACCYHCEHHHAWLRFRRGMAAMFILAVAVLGLLDYPHGNHSQGVCAHHSQGGAVTSSHREHRHHDRPRHAGEHRARPRQTPASSHRPARQLRSARHRGSPAPGTTLATADHGLTWSDFHGILLPVSAAAGPRYRSRGLASGFADTPRGALLAAVNIAVRTAASWGPAIFRPTIARQVTGQSARALLRADIRAYSEPRASGTAAGKSAAVAEGYRFLTYTHATATVDLVARGPDANGNPVLAVTRLRVVWLHGDWRLVAPPAGNWAKAAAPITSLAGYTIFPGQG